MERPTYIISVGIIKMNLLLLFVFVTPYTVDAKSDLRKMLNSLLRDNRNAIIRLPRDPSELPPAEPIQPGHTLLRPAFGMLKSSLKFPHRDVGHSQVYGNPDNIGLKFGRKNEYLRYTDFRRDTRLVNKGNAEELLNSVLDVVQKVSENEHGEPHPEVLVAVDDQSSAEVKPPNLQLQLSALSDHSLQSFEDQIGAAEILDESSEPLTQEVESNYDGRRRKKPSSSSSSSSSNSDEYEKNPGNTYTLYKDRYKQNWLWNFQMGDHMNVNPYGPSFSGGAPSGDMFFARKWWYFNQDDYVPF